jgi:hypothetical protein
MSNEPVNKTINLSLLRKNKRQTKQKPGRKRPRIGDCDVNAAPDATSDEHVETPSVLVIKVPKARTPAAPAAGVTMNIPNKQQNQPSAHEKLVAGQDPKTNASIPTVSLHRSVPLQEDMYEDAMTILMQEIYEENAVWDDNCFLAENASDIPVYGNDPFVVVFVQQKEMEGTSILKKDTPHGPFYILNDGLMVDFDNYKSSLKCEKTKFVFDDAVWAYYSHYVNIEAACAAEAFIPNVLNITSHLIAESFDEWRCDEKRSLAQLASADDESQK